MRKLWDRDTVKESFIWDLAKLGYCWQFITLAGFHNDSLSIDLFAKEYAKRGAAAYVQMIQRKEREAAMTQSSLSDQARQGLSGFSQLPSSLFGDIYIYMLWSYYLVQVWPFWKLLSGTSLFFSKTPIAQNTIKIGVSALFFWKKNCAQTFWKLLSGPRGVFLRRSQLGPENNFQLGPDNNFQKCHFFVIFCFEKCAKMPIVLCFFEKQPKNAKKKPPQKTITFHILQNTGS